MTRLVVCCMACQFDRQVCGNEIDVAYSCRRPVAVARHPNLTTTKPTFLRAAPLSDRDYWRSRSESPKPPYAAPTVRGAIASYFDLRQRAGDFDGDEFGPDLRAYQARRACCRSCTYRRPRPTAEARHGLRLGRSNRHGEGDRSKPLQRERSPCLRRLSLQGRQPKFKVPFADTFRGRPRGSTSQRCSLAGLRCHSEPIAAAVLSSTSFSVGVVASTPQHG